MKMYITEQQARELLENRKNSTFDNQGKRVYNRTGKAAKKRIYADVRRAHGIPHSRKIKFFIEDPSRDHYRVISDKLTGEALDNGIAAPVAVAVAAPKVKAPAKTAAPKAKAPAKTVAKTAKPATKVVKAPVKAVAKVKTVVKAPAKSVTKDKPATKVVKPAAKAVKTVAKPATKKTVAKKSK